MQNIYLKAKVQQIVISDCKVECNGSLTLDEDIMDKLGVQEYEQVFINSKHGRGRIMTYFLSGKRGSGICEVNGGAAQHFHKGEIVHLLVFALSDIPVKTIVI